MEDPMIDIDNPNWDQIKSMIDNSIKRLQRIYM